MKDHLLVLDLFLYQQFRELTMATYVLYCKNKQKLINNTFIHSLTSFSFTTVSPFYFHLYPHLTFTLRIIFPLFYDFCFVLFLITNALFNSVRTFMTFFVVFISDHFHHVNSMTCNQLYILFYVVWRVSSYIYLFHLDCYFQAPGNGYWTIQVLL